MNNSIKIILLIIVVLCVVGFSQSQILNLAYDESNGSIQAIAVGRGDLSPQSPTAHLSADAIFNLAYDSTNGAVQIILDNDSSGLLPETATEYDFLQYDGATWDNTSTPTLANNTWLRWRNQADDDVVEVFRVYSSTDILGVGTRSRFEQPIEIISAGTGASNSPVTLIGSRGDAYPLFRVQENAAYAAVWQLYDHAPLERIRLQTYSNYHSYFNVPGGFLGVGTESPDTKLHVVGDIKQQIVSSNVANPPTDAQLDALFTSPAAKGDGWTCYIDDSDSDNFYQIVASGSLWMIFTATKGL